MRSTTWSRLTKTARMWSWRRRLRVSTTAAPTSPSSAPVPTRGSPWRAKLGWTRSDYSSVRGSWSVFIGFTRILVHQKQILLGNYRSSGQAVEECDQQGHLEGKIQRSSGFPRPHQITCRGRKLAKLIWLLHTYYSIIYHVNILHFHSLNTLCPTSSSGWSVEVGGWLTTGSLPGFILSFSHFQHYFCWMIAIRSKFYFITILIAELNLV